MQITHLLFVLVFCLILFNIANQKSAAPNNVQCSRLDINVVKQCSPLANQRSAELNNVQRS